ncbi:M23 family metallopeptidase [Roseomonas frigidaquae]|uniref:M23 family metallopeptidase n=3 Tax=Acetobacterales TaxID=3120395 RepID=A0ABS6HIB9_9PROT|nr:M23 family metallopeptidase [Roseomonas oleicola]NKE45260.1 M23 family metallopeptidase [Falsiroseomonas frigidaquae]
MGLRCIILGITLAFVPATGMAAPCPAAMPVAGELSSGFGPRHGRMHSGIDLRAPEGTTVIAAGRGVVLFAGRYFDYGLMVEIEHPDGSRARYAHLARFAPGIRAGTLVNAAVEIGVVGRTGRTTGANLHVELRRGGRPENPWPWLTRTACVPLTEVAEAPTAQ